MTIKSRIEALEAQAAAHVAGDYPPYLSAENDDELARKSAALPADWIGKCYIGVSPDMWDATERATPGEIGATSNWA